MILEGYNVTDCHCGTQQELEFNEVKYFDKPRFFIICPTCGNAGHGSVTKESAVHNWNKHSKQVLLG